LTYAFIVATVKCANRVRSSQGRIESKETWCIVDFGDWEAALVWVDDLAPKTKILYFVAFVDRGDVRRIISLRRANRREVKRYAESF
jgi:hypothetical protein